MRHHFDDLFAVCPHELLIPRLNKIKASKGLFIKATREPWWNRKSGATAVSRRSKFLSGHRLSLSSAATDAAENGAGSTNTPMVDATISASARDGVSFSEDNQSIEYESSSNDVTPTRDEPSVWEVIDNTVETEHSVDTTKISTNHRTKRIVTVCKSPTTEETEQRTIGLDNPKKDTQTAVCGKASEYYGPPEPCPSISSLDNDYSVKNVKSKDLKSVHGTAGKSVSEPRTQHQTNMSERQKSTLSDVSTSTSFSDKSSTNSKNSMSKRSPKDKTLKYTKSKDDKSSKKQSKKSKSDSRNEERRPRTLTVAYDKLREKNGTSLPPRTYDPLDPHGINARRWTHSSTKPYTQRSTSSKRQDSGGKQLSHHGSRKSSSERGSDSTSRLDRGRSSSQDDSKEETGVSSQSQKFPNDYDSNKPSLTSSQRLGKKLLSKHSSSHSSQKYSRSKVVYSSHVKRTAIKKLDKPSDHSSWMKVFTDGIGIQKIRQNQRKTFLATCVEEYSLQTNGSMAKDVKPLLAFKVGNPQFVSEFYEKKTELNELPMLDGLSVTRIMKEKFAFKVKIGLEKLDTFITEGITVNGQSSFFSQFRTALKHSMHSKNAVLLYRYADVCLAWTSSKNIPKTTPIFLLIHKVVYGRCKTYSHLGDAMYLKKEHQCDCLKASLIGMRRKDEEQSEIRRGLACSKVVLADFERNTGKYRERPRQILPYAIVLYGKTSLTETEQSDLKELVLDWKNQFEAHRWKLLTTPEHSHKQLLMQQQQSQLAQHSKILPLSEVSLMSNNITTAQPSWQQMPPRGMQVKPPSLLGSITCSPPFVENSNALQSGLGRPPFRDIHGNPNNSMPPSYSRQSMLPLSVDASMLSQAIDNHSFTPPIHQVENHSDYHNSQGSPSRKRRRSHSKSSIESDSHSSKSKHSRGDRPVDIELDRMVSQALSSHRRSLVTKDVGVQVKTQSTIISLQKKTVSLSASTQTPDLQKDDSYEATLLRGGPLEATCPTCQRKLLDSSSDEPSGETTSGSEMLARLFTNGNERPRQFKSLSVRFAGADDKSSMDEMLLDFE
ncbi:uncharacterized protein [Watersipora subatra]|uniref:uncharacterized protein n=1 Tax=Watersipora subatra TaxID=2589382 RepID=UPI00355B6507